MECSNCGKSAVRTCAACQTVYYCSKECQVKDWIYHREPCIFYRGEGLKSKKSEDKSEIKAGANNLGQLTMVSNHLSKVQGWRELFMSLSSTIFQEDFSGFAVITHPHLKDSQAEFWTLFIVYVTKWRTYHVFVSDQPKGILSNKGVCCSKLNQVFINNEPPASAEIDCLFTVQHRSQKKYMQVVWDTGIATRKMVSL